MWKFEAEMKKTSFFLFRFFLQLHFLRTVESLRAAEKVCGIICFSTTPQSYKTVKQTQFSKYYH